MSCLHGMYLVDRILLGQAFGLRCLVSLQEGVRHVPGHEIGEWDEGSIVKADAGCIPYPEI